MDVEVEGQHPVRVAAVEDRACRDEAGDVGERVDRADLRGQRGDRGGVKQVERHRLDPLDRGERGSIAIQGEHARTFVAQAECGRAADAMGGGGHEHGFVVEAHGLPFC